MAHQCLPDLHRVPCMVDIIRCQVRMPPVHCRVHVQAGQPFLKPLCRHDIPPGGRRVGGHDQSHSQYNFHPFAPSRFHGIIAVSNVFDCTQLVP